MDRAIHFRRTVPMRSSLVAIVAGATLGLTLHATILAQEAAPAPPRPNVPATRPAVAPANMPAHLAFEGDVEYGRAGDRPLLLDVYRQKAKQPKPLPAVVWIHGGGWRNGDKAAGAGRVKDF